MIRVRITNNKPELTHKSGSIGTRLRKEIIVKLKEDEFANEVRFMREMGYKKRMVVHRKNFQYLYKGIEFL